MSGVLSDDITSDFINELKDYIPLLRNKTDKVKNLNRDASDIDLTELHRLIKAIRGASALIKLNNLSKVASSFEVLVEEILTKKLAIDTVVFSTINSAIDYFDAYTKEIPCNDNFNSDMLTDVLNALLDTHKIASSDDRHDNIVKINMYADGDDEGSDQFESENLECDRFDKNADQFKVAENEILDPSREQRLEPATGEWKATPNGDGAGQESIDLPYDELLESFYQEAEDHIQDLGKAVSVLEQRIITPTEMSPDEKELMRLMRRSVHTVKGAAAVVKLKPIANWGHEFENLLDWFYEGTNQVTPDDIKIIADGATILECFVNNPEKVDPKQIAELKQAFKGIIGSQPDIKIIDNRTIISESTTCSTEIIEALQPEKPQKNSNSPSHLVDHIKSLRVDFSKIQSLSTLGGELTIALSAFDQDMEGLGSLIGEIEQAQSRLHKTAQELELGYEHQSIGNLDTTVPMIENAMIVGEDTATCSEFDALELDRYSELDLIIRSLFETAADVGTIGHQVSKIFGGFKTYLHNLRMLHSQLNEKITRMQMTPMSTIANRMHNTVRETAFQLKKKVRLILQGEHIELDKMVWEKLADPLMHLLRNAVDHGIESRKARQEAGKPDTAVIRLEAAYQGNQVVLRIGDDGGGLDYSAICNAGLLPDSASYGEALSPDEMNELIFQPGFSTRQCISEVSGRGVGLDVVKQNILGLKGTVCVEKSEKGIGTTFKISLPLRMAVTKAIIFGVGRQRYATTLFDIKEVLRVNPEDLLPQGDNTIYLDGRRLKYYDLTKILTGSDPENEHTDTQPQPLVLVLEKESWKAAISIERIYSQRDIVVKSLGSHLAQVKGISGATVMGDGQVIPILNLEELLNVEPGSTHHPFPFKLNKRIQKPLEILIVDDSVTIRNVVSRLMQRQGWNAVTARDGVEAIEILYTRHPNLIILDIEMPRMNGYEFLSSIRSQHMFNELPVIMHTSRASTKHREKAEALGVNAFVTKPYEDEDLIALVKDLARKN